jgi:thioredoxin-related protein
MKSLLFNVFFACVFLIFFSNPARSLSLLDLELADLQEKQTLSLREIVSKEARAEAPNNPIILLSFFEPNCPWCYRQMKVFNKIEASCHQHIQPVVVGINGDVRALRKEIRKAKVNFPALKASKELMQQLSVPATPWTLLIDADGRVVTTIRGYVPLKDFADVFRETCEFKHS